MLWLLASCEVPGAASSTVPPAGWPPSRTPRPPTPHPPAVRPVRRTTRRGPAAATPPLPRAPPQRTSHPHRRARGAGAPPTRPRCAPTARTPAKRSPPRGAEASCDQPWSRAHPLDKRQVLIHLVTPATPGGVSATVVGGLGLVRRLVHGIEGSRGSGASCSSYHLRGHSTALPARLGPEAAQQLGLGLPLSPRPQVPTCGVAIGVDPFAGELHELARMRGCERVPRTALLGPGLCSAPGCGNYTKQQLSGPPHACRDGSQFVSLVDADGTERGLAGGAEHD